MAGSGFGVVIIATAFLLLLAGYLACGLLVAIPFVLLGVNKIDPHAARGSWGGPKPSCSD